MQTASLPWCFLEMSHGLAEWGLEELHDDHYGSYWTDLWSSSQRRAWHCARSFIWLWTEDDILPEVSAQLKHYSQVPGSRLSRWETNGSSFAVFRLRQDHSWNIEASRPLPKDSYDSSFPSSPQGTVSRLTRCHLVTSWTCVEPLLGVPVPTATRTWQGKDINTVGDTDISPIYLLFFESPSP